MKTAMQELIDEMTSINWHLYSYEDKIKIINVHFEKEKDQLYHSFYAGGGVTSIQDFKEEFDKYYNEVYKCE